jgi:hypothetical protein
MATRLTELLVRTLTRAVLRMEKKLDEILRMQKAKDPGFQVQKMDYTGQVCPLCTRPVEYHMVYEDPQNPEVMRTCGCTTTMRQYGDLSSRRK